ncbi:MAG: sigma-70 family RNA polymerase sigma factor [Lachnospiraceae bacterium]|nr:sigma-70 family RNA polymerase sigma factor [Lachnospiraceae bacterium]
MVYRMAYSLLKDRYDAEDIHQEVFMNYLKRRPRFESDEHAKAWFLRVTINACKNVLKTAWRKRVVSLGETDLDRLEVSEEGAGEALDDIAAMVKRLPQKYRIVIHLFYYEELSVLEIAEILHAKPSTVRTQLTRARAKLKEFMED